MPDFSTLPYAIHTNRELELMLTGVKPLAVFADEYPAEPCEQIIPEIAFAPHVQSGRMVQREYVAPLHRPPAVPRPDIKGIRTVMYALPQEEWRIDALIELRDRARTTGWSEECERREGFLLGYEDWQNDAWIAFQLRQPHAAHFPWLRRLAAKSSQPVSSNESMPAAD